MSLIKSHAEKDEERIIKTRRKEKDVRNMSQDVKKTEIQIHRPLYEGIIDGARERPVGYKYRQNKGRVEQKQDEGMK